jgi:hypothetical protein
MKSKFKFFGIIALVIGLLSAWPIIYRSSSEVVEVTVEDKERITDKEDSYYLVYTDKGVFKNSDSFWFWKYDSSDLYGKLHIGETYTLKIAEWRGHFAYWYRNIICIVENE